MSSWSTFDASAELVVPYRICSVPAREVAREGRREGERGLGPHPARRERVVSQRHPAAGRGVAHLERPELRRLAGAAVVDLERHRRHRAGRHARRQVVVADDSRRRVELDVVRPDVRRPGELGGGQRRDRLTRADRAARQRGARHRERRAAARGRAPPCPVVPAAAGRARRAGRAAPLPVVPPSRSCRLPVVPAVPVVPPVPVVPVPAMPADEHLVDVGGVGAAVSAVADLQQAARGEEAGRRRRERERGLRPDPACREAVVPERDPGARRRVEHLERPELRRQGRPAVVHVERQRRDRAGGDAAGQVVVADDVRRRLELDVVGPDVRGPGQLGRRQRGDGLARSRSARSRARCTRS